MFLQKISQAKFFLNVWFCWVLTVGAGTDDNDNRSDDDCGGDWVFGKGIRKGGGRGVII